MVHPDRKREDNEHDESKPPHRIAVEPPARRLRHKRIERDISRHQPEIDDRVERHREQRAPEAGVDQIAPAESPRQQNPAELEENASRRPGPENCRRSDREHRERHGTPGVLPLPGGHIVDHQHNPDHRAADEKERAAIVPGARQQRRIESVEHRRLPRQNCNDGHERAQQANCESDPGRRHAAYRTAQARRRDGIAEAHYEERGDHVGHRRAVQGDRSIIGGGVVERRWQRTAHQHLPGP